MAALGKLVTMVTANTTGFRAELTKAGTHVQTFAGKAKASLGNVKTMLAGLGAAAGAKWVIGLTSEMENLEVSFGTMLKSGEKAKAMLADLQQFAAVTPFETTELASASKLLLAFGVQQKDIIPTLTRLGDVASAINIPLGELADLYGKMRIQGRLFAQDINQLTGRGIPVIQEFAKQFGVADDAVRQLVHDGKIGFRELEKAIISLTAEGSMFGGGMEKQSQTLAGQWSTIRDNVKMMAIDLGNVALPAMKEMVSTAATLMRHLSGGNSDAADGAWAMMKDLDKRMAPRQTRTAIREQLKEIQAAQDKLLAANEQALKRINNSRDGTLKAMWAQEIDENTKAIEALNRRAGTLFAQAKRPLDDFTKFNDELSSMNGKAKQFNDTLLQGITLGVEKFKELRGQAKKMQDDALERVKQFNEMKDRAQSIFDATRTPLESSLKDKSELLTLFNKGMIDKETLLRAVKQRDEQFKRETGGEKKEAQPDRLNMSGIREVQRQIQMAALGGKPKDQKELADINKKADQLAHLKTMNDTLARIETKKSFEFVG